MYWVTLPNWVWIIVYLFLLVTLVVAIIRLNARNSKIFSATVIILTITIPLNGMINSIGRDQGINEFEHLISNLQVGSLWAIYVTIGLIYLFAWWIVILVKLRK